MKVKKYALREYTGINIIHTPFFLFAILLNFSFILKMIFNVKIEVC